MGQCLEIYSVSRASLAQIINSGDDSSRRKISGRSRRGIEKVSELHDWSTARGKPTIFEAIRHLVMDDERTLEDHRMYYEAYKFLVEPNSSSLSNTDLGDFDDDYLTVLNTELQEAGGTLDLHELAKSGAPADFRIPSNHEGVNTGIWDEESIASNLVILNQHEELSPTLMQIRIWLAHAHSHQNMLVGFHTS